MRKFDQSAAERLIGYTFRDKNLLVTCFTHSSYAHEHGVESNERLEFLGDAVLGCIVSEYLFAEGGDEGKMTERRQELVSAKPLKRAIEKTGLQKLLILSDPSNPGEKAISSLFEALVAGIYLDGGMAAAKKFVREKLIDLSYRDDENFKGELQEFLQAKKLDRAEYRLVSRSGEDHAPRFTVEVSAAGKKALGEGGSKSEAEKAAARKLLGILRKTTGGTSD